MLHHTPVGLLGRAVALAEFTTQQIFRSIEQRQPPAIGPVMLVVGIDEILDHHTGRHLKARGIAIELATQLRAAQAAGVAKVARYHTPVEVQHIEDYAFYGIFRRGGMQRTPPIAEIGPPLAADEACLAVEELAVGTVGLFDYGAFPIP